MPTDLGVSFLKVIVSGNVNLRQYKLAGLVHRAPLFAVALAVAALAGAATDAQAGLIVPWAESTTQQNELVGLEFAILPGAGSSSSSPAEPFETPRSPENPRREACPGLARVLDAGGGASAPVQGPSNVAGPASAALGDLPGAARIVHCSFSAWREVLLKYPQPAPGELLDPPKACA
ncbi:MAG: hypothetical protein ACT4QC_06105 [Planctomycetaceae bacterium]